MGVDVKNLFFSLVFGLVVGFFVWYSQDAGPASASILLHSPPPPPAPNRTPIPFRQTRLDYMINRFPQLLLRSCSGWPNSLSRGKGQMIVSGGTNNVASTSVPSPSQSHSASFLSNFHFCQTSTAQHVHGHLHLPMGFSRFATQLLGATRV
ncbi:hypothetical protein BKA62DRAFT_509646 [Auriculariales sp. MPI-PUGE-AT-0066]|nr:hypothetical protein BKA62DRAFT_509646 [Auriculariales sp. MPI-PUGE-AT-0066]